MLVEPLLLLLPPKSPCKIILLFVNWGERMGDTLALTKRSIIVVSELVFPILNYY